MRTVAHFFGEDVGGIDLPSDVLDVERLILHPFANGIVAKLNMTCSLRSHVIRPLDAGLIIIVENCWGIGVWNDVASLFHAPGEIAKVYHLFGCGIRSLNFSLPRALREVRSCRSPSLPRRPPFLKIMPPFMLRNLKSGRRMPSATELPSWEPQHASLYAERVLEEPRDGGIASSYASTSEDGG